MNDSAAGVALPDPGERVSLHVRDAAGTADVVGFVTAVNRDSVEVQDRHARVLAVAWDAVAAWKRVPPSRGRDPVRTPAWLLDELAARAGVAGDAWVARISDLLAGRRPPAAVPPPGEWLESEGVRARFEGEWVTLGGGSPEAWVDAAWWATRSGARSIQVRSADPEVADRLRATGFERLG